jgi:hypothetical protein
MGKKADRRRIDGESRTEVDMNIPQFLDGGKCNHVLHHFRENTPAGIRD